jgi:hypothetical protein
VTRIPLHWRIVGIVAAAAGYGAARIGMASGRIDAALRPMRGWRTVEAAGVRLRVPPGWGEVERSADGGLVIHNRPRHARIDGDAVWYASAMELHIAPGDRARAGGDAMTVVIRTLGHGGDRVTLSLCIARGVSAGPRRAAERVLASARLGDTSLPDPRAEADDVTPLAHPRVATVPRKPATQINQTSGWNPEGEGS